MAVTSIWPIKGRVDKVIDYARNPEKTTEASRKKLHEIEGVLDYAADEMKTEQCQYVTGINVSSVETAAKEFMHTKWIERKTDGRVCFHGYQSFCEGEVDAETAHKIGVALATELWGDRFQVIVATHCNTNHYHSHFIINSVSEADGKKFRNSHADYRRMREVSDRLCKEYGLSVIKYPEGKEVKLCSEIEARSTEVADNLKEIQQEKFEQRKEKEQHELFRRSRTGRADLA